MVQKIKIVAKFGAEGGSLTVERKKSGDRFLYRLHYYDCTALLVEDEDELSIIDKRSEWFSSLEQALSHSKWYWPALTLVEVAPDVEDELNCFAKTLAEPWRYSLLSFLKDFPEDK